MSGRFPGQTPAKEESAFAKFKKTPGYIIGTQVALFGLGIAFIQSSLMDMLVPQL